MLTAFAAVALLAMAANGWPKQQWVAQAYADLAGWRPSLIERTYLALRLDRQLIALRLLESHEAHLRLESVYSHYYLGREKTGDDQIERGSSLETTRTAYISSEAYFHQAGGTAEGFVERAFADELHRKPLPEEVQSLRTSHGSLLRALLGDSLHGTREYRCRRFAGAHLYLTGKEIEPERLEDLVAQSYSSAEHDVLRSILLTSAYEAAVPAFPRPIPSAAEMAERLRRSEAASRSGKACEGISIAIFLGTAPRIQGAVFAKDRFPTLNLMRPVEFNLTDPDCSERSCIDYFAGRFDAMFTSVIARHQRNGTLRQMNLAERWPRNVYLLAEGFTAEEYPQLIAADVTGDAMQDLLALTAAGELLLLPSPLAGSATLRPWVTLPFKDSQARLVALRANAGTLEDVLVVSRTHDRAIKVLSRADGPPELQEIAAEQLAGAGAALLRSESIVALDVDRDGISELIVNGERGEVLEAIFLRPDGSLATERWATLQRGARIENLSADEFGGPGRGMVLGSWPEKQLLLFAAPLPSRRFVVYPASTRRPYVGWDRLIILDTDNDSDRDAIFVSRSGLWSYAVSTGRQGVPGVKVVAGEHSTETDLIGRFDLFELPAGRYLLRPSLLGYRFSPESLEVEAVPGLQTVNFSYRDNSRVANLSAEGGRHQPRSCVGYNQRVKAWSYNDASMMCGHMEAYMSSIESVYLPFAGCCYLPSDDILELEEVVTPHACPKDHIVTGFDPHDGKYRCTRINTERYQLGPPQSSRYWGLGVTSWGYTDVLTQSEIPAAVRYSLGRTGHKEWFNDGCVGHPVGSLLVAKTGKRCDKHFFSELQYRGAPGDPPAGAPVKMLPDCDELDDIFSPFPGCISKSALAGK